jgi:endoglucanase Acf2
MRNHPSLMWSRANPIFQRLAVGCLIACTGAQADEPASRQIGLGTVYSTPKSGLFSGKAVLPVDPVFRTATMNKQAAPTNQWYSSVLFKAWGEPIHAHPATYRAGPQGFEVGYPSETPIQVSGRTDIAFPHQAALTLSPLAFQPQDARLAGRGDFSATIALGMPNGDALQATVVHGSPFSYYQLTRGDLRLRLAQGAKRCDAKTESPTLCVQALGHHFAIFAPHDAHWSETDSPNPILHFGKQDRFFSVALLPDGKPETLALFQRHAYAFVTDTVVDWHYEPATSQVETTFTARTQARADGQTIPILGLYPHQARALKSGAPVLGFQYASVRGAIGAIEASSFKVDYTYHGILPYWGSLQDSADRDRLGSLLVGDAARSKNLFTQQQGGGTYWQGKALAATAQLMCVAEQAGNLELRDKLLKSLKEHLETWFQGQGDNYFLKDGRLGTVVGYPDEYGNIGHMNDHHFHYGYWINAAAQVALRDPQWARKDRWGGMVDLLVADIATSERGRPDFPFLRNFDAYEGHSWASGDADFADGNNQESSSEAANAWAGLILWGSLTGNQALRDLGIWLYTTETEAISDYWFDSRRTVFSPAYGKVVAAQVFGGRYAYNTWWTEEPRQIQGINLLPITPASIYLGRDPDYSKRFMAALDPEKRAYSKRGMNDGTPEDIWQDILASFLALADPNAALEFWRPKGSVESGETRSHTLHWLLSLKEMGTPDFSVTADTPFYGVFRAPTGERTYLAFNLTDAPLAVRFSDQKQLTVAPHSLARSR